MAAVNVDVGIGEVFDFAETIISRIWPDANEADKRKIQAIVQTTMAIHATNTAQAQHAHWFVAGARPAIMWICGLGLLWDFFLWHFATWFSLMLDVPPPPSTDSQVLMSVLLGLLGIARTFEKFGGVARGNLREPEARTGGGGVFSKIWPKRKKRNEQEAPTNSIDDADFVINP